VTTDDSTNRGQDPSTQPSQAGDAAASAQTSSAAPLEGEADIGIDPAPETPPPTVASAAQRPAETAKPAEPAKSPERSNRPMAASENWQMPAIVAGLAAVVFVAACLAGQSGLFPSWSDPPATPSWMQRTLLVVRGLLMIPLSAGCLVAGAYLFHLVDRRPLGDLRTLSARMLMIASLAVLVRMVPIPIAFLKQSFDVLAPVALGWLLLVPLFRLALRDAGLVVGAAILVLVVLGFGSTIVGFALWTGTTSGADPALLLP
jgi:hypothetical protein